MQDTIQSVVCWIYTLFDFTGVAIKNRCLQSLCSSSISASPSFVSTSPTSYPPLWVDQKLPARLSPSYSTTSFWSAVLPWLAWPSLLVYYAPLMERRNLYTWDQLLQPGVRSIHDCNAELINIFLSFQYFPSS